MRTAIAGAVALLALAACSATSSEQAGTVPPASSVPAATTSPEASMIGPIVVEPSQTEVEATVGRSIVFDVGEDPGRWRISTDDPAVVSVEPGGRRGGATFNPGATALATGEAVVTLADSEGMDALEFRITVTG